MALQQALGQPAPGWQGRVKEAAYSSPTGVRVPFLFEDVSRETTLRTAEFQFSGLDESYIQQNGFGARKYPLRCIFSGSSHDKDATQFEYALLTKGIGELEHPFYGTFAVVPVGSFTRRDDLVSGANQTIIEVTFSTTLASVYPAGQGYPVSEIEASLGSFTDAANETFAATAELDTISKQADFKATVRGVLKDIRGAFATVGGITATARRAFEDQVRLVNEGLDTLVGSPLVLAQQISNLVLAPARALEGLVGRIDGYGRMLQGIVGNHSSTQGDSATLPDAIASKRNEFRLSDLVATTAVAGSVHSTTDTKFTTRPQALRAAEGVMSQLAQAIVWRDERLAALEQIDTGEAYQTLQEAVSQAAGFLVVSSFSLVPERRIVIDRDRTILDLCAEIYGTTSNERLDFLITSNDLSGSEILELKRGTAVLYYS